MHPDNYRGWVRTPSRARIGPIRNLYNPLLEEINIMTRHILLFVLITCMAVMSGCGSVGKDFDIEMAQTIQNGKTTQSDIKKMFGSPFKTGVQNGNPVWVYEKNVYRALGKDSSKSLIVEFDHKGIVTGHQIMVDEPGN